MQNKLRHVLTFVLLLGMVVSSCDDMESVHEEYLQGEKVYAGKLRQLHTSTGYKKILITGRVDYLGKSNQCIVEWDDQQRIFPIKKVANDLFTMTIDNLEERKYEFTVYTKDENGNESIKQKCVGKAVGDIFKNSQKTRRLTNVNFEEGVLYAYWADKAESEFVVRTEVSYTNTEDKVVNVVVLPADSKTELVNWKPLSKLKYVSYCTSGKNGFETLKLQELETILPDLPPVELDKTKFSMAHMPSDNKGEEYGARPTEYLFDGDGTWKNSDQYGYHSGGNSLPSHFTIDLGVNTKLRKCKMDLRDPNNYNGNNPTEVQIWGIVDITNAETPNKTEEEFIAKGWKLLYHGDIDGGNKPSVEFNIDTNEDVRYIRVKTLKAVNNDGVQYTELTFWGKNIQPVN